MTILDLLKMVKWPDVKRAIEFYYPADKGDYESVFISILSRKKRKHANNTEQLELYWHRDEDPTCSFFGMHTNLFSMSFRKWNELVNIPIAEDTLNHYRPEDIVAHFIWEITFYGTEEDSIKKGKSLYRSVAHFKKEHDNKKRK